MTEILNSVYDGIGSEIHLFFKEINYSYLILMSIVFYAMMFTEQFTFYKMLTKGIIEKYVLRDWVLSIFFALSYFMFRYLGPDGINSEYIAGTLRTLIFVVAFKNILIDFPMLGVQKLREILEKDKK